MRLNLGSLSGLRSTIADAIRPKAAGGSASFVQGWEALAYGSISPSATGIDVNPYSALRCAPVYAAVKVISESFAQIPLFMHQRDEKGSLGRELKHPLAELLHDMPNPNQTMFEFRQQMLKWLLTWGNAYAWIVRDHRGQVAELWPIQPEWVAVTFNMKYPLLPIYVVTGPDNTSHELHRGDLLHFKTFGIQSYKGDSPVLLNRETIAGWLVMEQHLSRLFGRGAKPSGVLESQRTLSPEGIKLLRTQFDSTFGGYENSSQTIVLEEGMQWKPMSMTSVDAQFQELRRAQLFEVCRIWRIPPLLMQDAEKSGMGLPTVYQAHFWLSKPGLNSVQFLSMAQAT